MTETQNKLASSDPGHGDSIASWTTVIIIMIATAVGTLAFWFDLAIVVWISAAVALAAVPVGIFLKRAGFGVGGEKSQKKD